ncbi:UvrD-helicase domain-containing protein [Sinorhizobium sp. BG8]|uniref:UvrD-helicase domain-containing protein n=1 Tax=Sinorhizobium sp. BG8 TaxID=2613773 RepID=UPI00193E44F0|nr:UvrD-helicase domain-containing protein [Sinorhizobium sp. BG8]
MVETAKKNPGDQGFEQDFEQPDDSLDRAQIIAADATARILVEAGPGTGKTELAARRLSHLVNSSLSPGQVFVLSFSRSAVRTLTRRISLISQTNLRTLEQLRHVSLRTFDSWTFRILRLMGYSPTLLLSRHYDQNIAELVTLIQGPRRDEVRNFIGERRHIIVDEFQDMPGIRGELVLSLLGLMAPNGAAECGFTVLGDPAQAIYGFAVGAGQSDASASVYWRRIRETYSGELQHKVLRHNYRAKPALAELSAKVRSVLLGDRPDEEKLLYVREAIAQLPPSTSFQDEQTVTQSGPGTHAILTRTNGEALRVMQRVLGNRVEGPTSPVRLHAGNYASLPPAWIGALLRKVRSPDITRSQFSRIYSHLHNLWDDETRIALSLPTEEVAWARLSLASGEPDDASSIQLSALRNRIGWPDAFPDDQNVFDEGVLVTTIHQSKGMEFDIVTILNATHNEGAEESESSEEEANIGFVAISRAGTELNRLGGDALYRSPTPREFSNGRERLCFWWNGWMNIEIGLRGDVDPYGFVDPSLHLGLQEIEENQDFLLKNARMLAGHKVMLCKVVQSGKAHWDIHLQNGNRPGRRIGRTSPQLTYDLLQALHDKGYALPYRILNLRISSVGTITDLGDRTLEEPERSSRLWLGVSLFGTGDFKTVKGNR